MTDCATSLNLIHVSAITFRSTQAIGLYLVNREAKEKDDSQANILRRQDVILRGFRNTARQGNYSFVSVGAYQKLLIIQALVSRDSLLMAR